MLKKYIRLNIDKSVDSPSAEEFFQLTRLATKKEKYVALTLLLLAVVSISLAIILISQAFIVSVPSFGGTFTEGIVGVPRFNNPLLASSDADRDLVALVYSGLLRSAQNGAYIPDLAENYSISNDGLQYTFNLRKNILWHDGVSISARDILFTVQLVQNNLIKSPKRANWEGLKVEVVDEHTVQFILKQPYAPFLENATLGILPEHIWSSISTDEFALSINNINAIGTGPYAIKSTKNDSSGVPSEINLTANPNFALGRPFIKNIKLHFYSDEEKLLEDRVNGVIEGASGISSEIASKELSGGNKVISSPLYRIFAVFFNTSQSSVLADKEVRKALELATPRKEIVSLALEQRQTAGIKIRQPLAWLEINTEFSPEYLELIRDEVNVKDVKIGSEIKLDTTITPELELEGRMRDLVRAIQEKRKEVGLQPNDKINVTLPASLGDLIPKFESEIKKSVHADKIEVGDVSELEIEKI